MRGNAVATGIMESRRSTRDPEQKLDNRIVQSKGTLRSAQPPPVIHNILYFGKAAVQSS